MRLIHALLHAMCTRRTQQIGLNQADRWVTGDRPGPDHQGLAELLTAVKAPATAEELAGERAAVAGFAAAHRRAASPKRRRSRVRMSRTPRTVVVNVAAGLALVAGAGTAAAARTGNLPDGAQQHAHRLFSALGIPPPRTGPANPKPVPQASTPRTTSRPSPTPAPGVSTTSTTEAVPAGWCRAWSAAPHNSDAPWRRNLIEAAGSEHDIPAYCAALSTTAHPASRTTTAARPAPAKPSGSQESHGKPSSLPTPDHHGKSK
jgi:hypothetical protein